MAVPDENKKYTYADLLSWTGEERYELFEGEPRLMTSPSAEHQGAAAELTGQFRNYLLGKNCVVKPAPYDVFLFASRDDPPEDIETVFQPDLSVICDKAKRTSRGCMGTPDLVVEILSPSTATQDRTDKLDLYEDAGVQEYWIIDLEKKRVAVYLSEQGEFKHKQNYIGSQKVPVGVLNGLEIDMGLVYDAAVA